EGFRAGMARLGAALGAKETGISVYELPPGQAICPYHYECGEEEWLLVLSGNPTLRTPDGEQRLSPWDLTCFPRGPEGAHAVRNQTEEPARVLMFSTVVVPTATVYPDSDKVGIWTGDEATDVLVRRSSRVEYYDGET
ncbi:MAG TPA: cupin domain-containing protein, partial [Solirubrobacterales bacterium]|nr:cupin domain-containing protein [Solirubrobacterales bacterium]